MYRQGFHRAGVDGPQTFPDGQLLPDGLAYVLVVDCAWQMYRTKAVREADGRYVVWCACGYPIPVCTHERFIAHIERGEIVSTECLDCDLVQPERVAS